MQNSVMPGSQQVVDATPVSMSQSDSRAAVSCQECIPCASDISISELRDTWQRLRRMSVRRVPKVSQALLQRRQRQFQHGCKDFRKGGLASCATLAGEGLPGGRLTAC